MLINCLGHYYFVYPYTVPMERICFLRFSIKHMSFP